MQRSVAVLCIAGFLVAGCSSDGESAEAGPAATNVQAATSAAPTTTSGVADAPPPTTTIAASTTTSAADETQYHPARIDLPESIGGLEGVVADPQLERVYFGDLTNGDVWVLESDGILWRIAVGADQGRSAAVGLALNDRGTRLYVAGGDSGFLHVLDIDNGEVLERYELSTEPGTMVNDVDVADDGTAYVTNSGGPQIWRISPDADEAEVFLDYAGSAFVDTTAAGLQGNGIVVDGDALLFVHMASNKLLRVDRATAEMIPVDIPGDVGAGRDGLVLCGDTLLGVDISAFTGGEEVVRVTELAADRLTGTSQEGITNEEFSFISTAALLGDQLVVANAQFGVAEPVKPFWLTAIASPC